MLKCFKKFFSVRTSPIDKTIFDADEEKSFCKFKKNCELEINILNKMFVCGEELLQQTKLSIKEHEKYLFTVYFARAVTFLTAGQLLIYRGYNSAAENMIKAAIELILIEPLIFNDRKFSKQCMDAKYSLKQIMKNKQIKNRKELAKELDKLNAKINFLPTEERNFFEKYVYEMGYQQSNRFGHSDIDVTLREVRIPGEEEYLRSTQNIFGPNFTQNISETVLYRLTFWLSIQLSLFANYFKLTDYTKYKKIMHEFTTLTINK